MSRTVRIVAVVLVVLPFMIARRTVVAAEDRRAACISACSDRCQESGCQGSGGDCRYHCQKDCPAAATPLPSTTGTTPTPTPREDEGEDEDAGARNDG